MKKHVGSISLVVLALVWLTPALGQRNTRSMVRIDGGSFFRGSERQYEARRGGEVTLSPYRLDRTEVSVADYRRCVRAGACEAPSRGSDQNNYLEGRERHPVNFVSWDDASAYCTWAGKRLPTEAEWEHAARGASNEDFPWSRGVSWNEAVAEARRANLCDRLCSARHFSGPPRHFDWEDAHVETAPVGTMPRDRSTFGVLDLGGNVREWVNDLYETYDLDGGTVRDPQGPSEGSYRVIRGGAWDTQTPEHAAGWFRVHRRPSERQANLGFRCADGSSNR